AWSGYWRTDVLVEQRRARHPPKVQIWVRVPAGILRQPLWCRGLAHHAENVGVTVRLRGAALAPFSRDAERSATVALRSASRLNGRRRQRSIASNSSSLSTGTPSDCALASLLPASVPTTTKLVFFDTLPAALPPSSAIFPSISVRLYLTSVPVTTTVLPASTAGPLAFGASSVIF